MLGAGGFVGRHLGAAAEHAGFEVIAASRRPGPGERAFDITDSASVEALIAEAAPDAVANLTGFSSVARSWKDPDGARRVNVDGTRNLLRAVADTRPDALVLAISSGEVYGAPGKGELPLTEDRELRPVTPYGESKAAMEGLCAELGGELGLRIALVRAFNHIGPGQSDEFVASSFARQIAAARLAGLSEVELATGNLSPARDFTDVRDIVAAYLLVIQSGLTGTFNACSGSPVTVERLLELLGLAAGVRVTTTVDPERMRPVDVPVLFGSAERLAASTGWKPMIPLEKTLSDLLDWWQASLGEAPA